jgi:tRNA threonylcarbamoyl adenosine modification protein YeaZ
VTRWSARDAPAGAGRLVLGLDTATVVTVGVARDDQVLATATVADRLVHAEQLMPSVRSACARAGVRPRDLDLLVVGLGPGPFTGLRVGVVTARVLSSVLGIDLHGVCSLDVIATAYAEQAPGGDFVTATDARRREVYWARYDRDGRRQDGPRVSAPADVPRLPTVGPAAELYPDALAAVPGPRELDPALLAVRGPELPDAGREPLYLRRPDAAVPTRRKTVLVRRRGR